jgi:serine/threonine protein phosphatase PrpC
LESSELTTVPGLEANPVIERDPFFPGLGAGKKTDVGRHREQNEDTIYTFETFLQSSEGIIPFAIFVVADGMGGFQKGEIASSTATRSTVAYILQSLYFPFLTNPGHFETVDIEAIVRDAILTANYTVIENVPEAGTTITLAVVIDKQVYIGHVGDSRAYLYDGDVLYQLTKDHSLVARLVELGQATPEEASVHPQKNVLYRALGQEDGMVPDVYTHILLPQHSLLICSDGLWGMISDEAIIEVLSSPSSLTDKVNKLVEIANINGGEDNISVILAGIGQIS